MDKYKGIKVRVKHKVSRLSAASFYCAIDIAKTKKI